MKKNKLLFIVIMFSLIGLNIKAQVPHFWGMTTGYSYDFSSTIYQIYADGSGYQQVVINYPDWTVYGKLVSAPDGNFYGLAFGGQGSGGGLFKINPLTNAFTDVCDVPNIHLWNPTGNVTLANNGKLYATAPLGDSSCQHGGIFCYDVNANQTYTVYCFDSTGLSGSNASSTLLLANNGLLYGFNGEGANGYGVIFSFDPITNSYLDIYNMDNINGGGTASSMIQANNSLLYGMTSGGGTSNDGVIFSFDISTNTYTKLVDFTGSNGATPSGIPLEVNDSLLYGLTSIGGTENAGVIYCYNINSNTYSVVHNFDTLTGNIYPRGSLIQASNGKLYGTTGNTFSYLDSIGNSIFQFDPINNTYTDIFNFVVGINGTNGFGPGDLMESPLTSGIKTITNNKEISVYPNPANNTVTFRSDSHPNLIGTFLNSQLIITDVLGREIYHQPIINPNQTTINVSQSNNGVYFYQLTNGTETFRGKFVKE